MVWRLLRSQDEFPIALVGLFALSTQAIHACFDFGLYLPANMVLFALLCGAIASRAARLETRWRPGIVALPFSRRWSATRLWRSDFFTSR